MRINYIKPEICLDRILPPAPTLIAAPTWTRIKTPTVLAINPIMILRIQDGFKTEQKTSEALICRLRTAFFCPYHLDTSVRAHTACIPCRLILKFV